MRMLKFQYLRRLEFKVKITHKIKIIDKEEILRQIFRKQMCLKKSTSFASIAASRNILIKIVLIRQHHEKKN